MTTDDRVRFQRAPFDHPSLPVPNGTDVPAVGRNGGDEIGTFLGLDPFAASTQSAVAAVFGPGERGPQVKGQGQPGAQPQDESQDLTLVSYANRGKEYRLFAAVGNAPVGLPAEGIASPSRMQLGRLRLAGHHVQLVASGRLDAIGTATVSVSAPSSELGGRVEYFFEVVEPATKAVLAVSSSASVSPTL